MKHIPLLVIASYPPKSQTHHQDIVGGASYTKNTLVCLQDKCDITVLAEVLPSSPQTTYDDNGITVKRVWQRGSLLSYITLLTQALKHQSKHVLFSFEFAMFGNMFFLIPLPFFLGVLGVLGKKVTLICHHALDNVQAISGHMNIARTDPRLPLLNVILHIFYTLLLASVAKVIVFDQALKKNLTRFSKPTKITVIPHAVESFTKTLDKESARKKLHIAEDKFVVLVFGFLAWYKGTDFIVDLFVKHSTFFAKNNIQLMIAGGPNPNHVDKLFYKKYIAQIQEEAKKHHILFSGFVPQKEIPNYFQASDIALFPYRTYMSASGPLSMAFSFGQPFLISKHIKGLLDTADIAAKLSENKLKKEDVIFPLNDSLKDSLVNLKKNALLTKQIAIVASQLAKVRSWDHVGKKYYETIFQ